MFHFNGMSRQRRPSFGKLRRRIWYYISLFETYEKSRQIKVVFQSDMIFHSSEKKSRQIDGGYEFAKIFKL